MNYQNVMKIFTIIYILGAAFFFFLHNFIAELLGFTTTQMPFWVVLATSMMAMLSYISWQSSKTPASRELFMCHMLSKSVSVAGFIYYFFMTSFVWAFLIGAITDAAVIVIVASFYQRRGA
ncbi:MAG: hypothetical protein A2Z20_03160 [Bdellovibrionales bacterium RBG_16_40_8]|nr:MAG: hypothetical protein A2Z20_03160 [Bdellovibrionales bacterium RBG_16_40_8]